MKNSNVLVSHNAGNYAQLMSHTATAEEKVKIRGGNAGLLSCAPSTIAPKRGASGLQAPDAGCRGASFN